ncbi:short-chain dehydrogenase [Agrocybe pediades]|nr:short-chain dehydrogenase [Agrocybe pediades]
MKLTFLEFAKSQFYETVPPAPTTDLKGLTVVVTGANCGIGYEAAKHFARMSPGKLILACRSKARGEEALQSIRANTGCTTLELRILDLSSFASVQSFVQTFEDKDDRLDLLVENAGITPKAIQEFTKDGWETSVQVNNMSTSLLALLLLPRMLDTAKKHNTIPRIVVVSSETHYWTQLAEKVVFSENFFRTFAHQKHSIENASPATRYHDTKLLNVFFTRSLAEKLGNSPIIVNTVTPGFCDSNLRRDMSAGLALFSRLLRLLIGRTAEQGARQLVWSAISQDADLDELRGAYISSMQIMEPSDFIVKGNGKAIQDKLWVNISFSVQGYTKANVVMQDDLIGELSQVDTRVTDVVHNHLSTE